MFRNATSLSLAGRDSPQADFEAIMDALALRHYVKVEVKKTRMTSRSDCKISLADRAICLTDSQIMYCTQRRPRFKFPPELQYHLITFLDERSFDEIGV